MKRLISVQVKNLVNGWVLEVFAVFKEGSIPEVKAYVFEDREALINYIDRTLQGDF